MEDIMALSCKYGNSDGVMETLRSLGISFTEVYASPEAIADFAVALKAQRRADYCQLPFCHTVEAEAMGGDILLGDEAAGARASRLVYNSLADICERPIDYSGSRISKMLRACALLKSRGQTVIFSISGPLSILSCLLDITLLFKTWRKDEPQVKLLLRHFADQLLRFTEEICAAGADAISYADPVGIPKILGPKYAKEMALGFTQPFLIRMQEQCKGRANLYLCPMTAGVLKAYGCAELRDGYIPPCSGALIPACVKQMPAKLSCLSLVDPRCS